MGTCQACIQISASQNTQSIRAKPGTKKLSTELNINVNLNNTDQPRRLDTQKAQEDVAEDVPLTAQYSCEHDQQHAKTTDFDETFPVLAKTIKNIDSLTGFEQVRNSLKLADGNTLNQGIRSFFKVNMIRVLQEVDSELTSVLGDYWTDFKAQSSQILAIHTILVLWRATKQPIFAQMCDQDRNIIKWACLLHDLAKRGTPTILGRDHCHAFRSAAVTLQIFKHLGIWQASGPNQAAREAQQSHFETILRLIYESFQPLPQIWREDFRHGMPVVTQMNSHHNLGEIFYLLWDVEVAPKQSFIDLVFRLVLFHDGVESLASCPNMVNLTQDEKSKYCDTAFYKLMPVLLIADNEAYILFDEVEIKRCRKEITTLYDKNLQCDVKETASDSESSQGEKGQ